MDSGLSLFHRPAMRASAASEDQHCNLPRANDSAWAYAEKLLRLVWPDPPELPASSLIPAHARSHSCAEMDHKHNSRAMVCPPTKVAEGMLRCSLFDETVDIGDPDTSDAAASLTLSSASSSKKLLTASAVT